MGQITLLKAIVGSQAYGTNTPQSDIDIKGIYLQDPLSVMSFDYVDQYYINKDEQWLEVRRFLELIQTSNPTMLELLFTPEDCILEKHSIFDYILEYKQLFITKQCANSFMGYAKQQIHKAKGLDKKMNWEQNRVERKRPIDFMKVIDKEKSYPLVDYLKKQKMHEDCCGLVKVNNTEGLYCLYYDSIKDVSKTMPIDNPRYKDYKDHGYKGICTEDQVLVSEIPPYQLNQGIATIQYSLDSFQHHCRDYNQYQTWLKERNTQRYVDVKNHGQMIDGKNMLHCYRLIQMAKEIAETGQFNVRRPNAEELLKIRRGEVSLQELLDKADSLIGETVKLFEKSTLPDNIDREIVNNILKEIRLQSMTEFYG